MKIRLVARFALPLVVGLGAGCGAASSEDTGMDDGSSTTMASSSGETPTGPTSDSEPPGTSTGEPMPTAGSTSEPTASSTGSGESTGFEDTDGSSGGSSGGSTGGEDVGIDLPATIEMTFAFSGERAAALCNFLPADSDQNQYYLSTDVTCGTGTSYTSFRLNTTTGEYLARSGSLEVEGDSESVEFLDWSHGDIGNIPGGGMSLRPLPDATDITLETTFHETFTFRFDGNELTVTVLDPK